MPNKKEQVARKHLHLYTKVAIVVLVMLGIITIVAIKAINNTLTQPPIQDLNKGLNVSLPSTTMSQSQQNLNDTLSNFTLSIDGMTTELNVWGLIMGIGFLIVAFPLLRDLIRGR